MTWAGPSVHKAEVLCTTTRLLCVACLCFCLMLPWSLKPPDSLGFSSASSKASSYETAENSIPRMTESTAGNEALRLQEPERISGNESAENKNRPTGNETKK